jgi:hypothetical protein
MSWKWLGCDEYSFTTTNHAPIHGYMTFLLQRSGWLEGILAERMVPSSMQDRKACLRKSLALRQEVMHMFYSDDNYLGALLQDDVAKGSACLIWTHTLPTGLHVLTRQVRGQPPPTCLSDLNLDTRFRRFASGHRAESVDRIQSPLSFAFVYFLFTIFDVC